MTDAVNDCYYCGKALPEPETGDYSCIWVENEKGEWTELVRFAHLDCASKDKNLKDITAEVKGDE